jgi:pimeloyl-ACP methyl ester carboxylesterase
LGLDLLSVIEQVVPTGPLVLIGHSMGGMTIMSLADQRPDLFRNSGSSSSSQQQRVVAVLLTNTSAGELKEVTLGLPAALARLRGPVLPVVLRRAAKNVALVEKTRALGKDLAWVLTKHLSFATDDVDPAVVAFTTTMIAATPVDVVSHFYSTLMSHDGRLGLMNLTECSVLVFGAEQDALTPLRHAEAIAAALPAAELIRVPNAGHMLMLEHPDVVNKPLVQLVDAALRDTVGRRSPVRSARHRAAR